MSESTSLILFCVFIAVFVGLIVYNIILVKQTAKRVGIFLATVVLPSIPFILYYFKKAPGIKGTNQIPKDLGQLLLRMDLLTLYLVVVFFIQAAIMALLSVRKWMKNRAKGLDKVR